MPVYPNLLSDPLALRVGGLPCMQLAGFASEQTLGELGTESALKGAVPCRGMLGIKESVIWQQRLKYCTAQRSPDSCSSLMQH